MSFNSFLNKRKGGFMRRGFTLMEMVLVLAIISIVGGVGILSVKFYKTNKNKIDADYYLNATVGFINNSKMYCRENSCKAIIAFDMERNEMKFYSNFTIIKKLKFSDKIT